MIKEKDLKNKVLRYKYMAIHYCKKKDLLNKKVIQLRKKIKQDLDLIKEFEKEVAWDLEQANKVANQLEKLVFNLMIDKNGGIK